MDGQTDVRHTVLETATLSLRHGHDLRAILQEVTDLGRALVGAEYGAFFYNDRDERGERLDLLVLSGADPDAFPDSMPMRHTPLFAPTFQGAGAIRVDDVLADPRYGHNAYGGLPADHARVRSYLGAPVKAASGRVVGALLFAHTEPNRFDTSAEDVALSVAGQAAVAIDNALLFAAEQTARESAEAERAAAAAAARRLALLQEITALLSTAVTTADIIHRVPRAVTRALDCASATIYTLDSSRRALVGRGAPSFPEQTRRRLSVIPLDADTPAAEAVRSRVPVAVGREDIARYTDLAGLDLGDVSSAIIVPMFDRERRVVATLNAFWSDERLCPAADTELLTSVAGQVAQALERARLFDAERAAREQLATSVGALTELARTLQNGLLPHRMPELDRVEVAVRYQPAVAGVEVGGDWYDTITVDDTVVFVIGDVQGHSTTAAGLMGQVRTAVRAYLSEGHDPGAALERTNNVLVDLGADLFATCCLVQLDQSSGEVVIASAGHPAPLVADKDGVRELPVDPGLPLGIEEGTPYRGTHHRLPEPCRVVLYTDGVVESSSESIIEGVRVLSDTIERLSDATCDALADEVITGIPHRLTDDAALVVLSYAGPTSPRQEVTLELPADVRAVGQSRRFLRHVLETWNITGIEDVAELVVSELVTNALVHTDAPAELCLRYDSGGHVLRIAVEDSSTRHPHERHSDEESLGGRGLHIVDVMAQAWGVVPHGEGKSVWADLAISP